MIKDKKYNNALWYFVIDRLETELEKTNDKILVADILKKLSESDIF